MNMDPKIFKAYDIRGTYPEQINEEAVKKIGQAVVQILGAKKVVIGHDMRLSADTLYPKLRDGLVDAGMEVIDVGLCSTPMSYFANVYFDADASLMLTASHNPAQYNGFKLCGKDAQPFTAFEPTTEIYDYIQAGKIKLSGKKGTVREESILEAYTAKITHEIDLNSVKLGKIVVDTGNGMGGMTMPPILEKLGVEYTSLFFDLDGNFPNHEANPLKTHTLKVLQEKVREEKTVLGVAIDGDADRIGFVDENGEVIGADMIAILVAKEMLKEKPDLKVMYDLRSSWAVKEEIEKEGGSAEMCVVGHGLIKPIMRKDSVDFAGELSAHYYFKELSYTDNADKALVFILKLLAESGKKISELVAPFKRYYHTGEINFEVSDPKAKIEEIKDKVEGGKQFELDGLTVEFENWWFNVRPSNTEPLLRLNLEARSAKLRDEKLKYVIDLIGSEPVE